MYVIRNDKGEAVHYEDDATYAAEQLRTLSKMGRMNDQTFTLTFEKVDKYVVTFTATEHHTTWPVGHMEIGYEKMPLEEAVRMMEEDRSYWSQTKKTRDEQGPGFEIWTIGLRKVA